ncbi:MAG TPA: TolC family protein [Candidatus Eisenbacteria bacterium]|nr:TolC family protein [Candidatus Eisenbacteria bacterium]
MTRRTNFTLQGFRRAAAVAAGLTLAVALAAGRSAAQDDAGTADAPRRVLLGMSPDSALTGALAQITGTPLTLSDATAQALEQATDVREARGAMLAARGAMRSEKGAFDPELFAAYSQAEADAPQSTPFAGASVLRTKEIFASGGARVKLPIGTELSASLETSKLESNSVFSALNPQYDAAAAFRFRQPLLKGFGPAAWGARSAASRDFEAAQARYEDVVARTRAVVEQVYWDLYAAERDLAVQRLLRDNARSFLDQAELRGKAGIVGPVVVANARVFLSEQEQAVLDREEQYDKISDRLGSLLGRRPSSESARYRPIDNPPHDFAVEPEDSVVARAMVNNRSLAAGERDVASARARALEAKWNIYPQLDVVGSIGGVGLSGTSQDIVFGGDTLRTTYTGDLGDATSDAVDRSFPNWSLGAVLSIPIGFRQGRGEHERTKGELEQAEQRYIAARRSLEEQVRAAHRELVHSVKRLEAARMGIDAALEQARVGLLEYGLGKSTSFDLVRIGADVASSQQRYSAALVRTAKAVAEIRWLTSGGVAADATSTGKTTP